MLDDDKLIIESATFRKLLVHFEDQSRCPEY